jgi:hypothetical protein
VYSIGNPAYTCIWLLATAYTQTRLTMRQYYVLTRNPIYKDVLAFIKHHNLACEIHINRIRFWVPDGRIFTEFYLLYGDSCPLVDPGLDLATGLPISTS